MTRNIRFLKVTNDQLLAYYKATGDYSNIVIVVVNLDVRYAQGGMVELPLHEFGIAKDRPYAAHDLITGEKYTWHGERNFVDLNPARTGIHIIRVTKEIPREGGFDYFL
jgi:starch synthase (maltosyl-transferring)